MNNAAFRRKSRTLSGRSDITSEGTTEGMDDMATEATGAAEGPRKVRGGKVRWAAQCGFPTSTIFPIIPPERSGIRNVFEFQPLMYRPLYWLGTPDGQTG